jgi:3-oxoacyl-[acyl-carrier protein] reductase
MAIKSEEKSLMKFQNRVAVVTGGSRGIGYQVGKKLAAEGANVISISKTGSSDKNLINSLKADVSSKIEVDQAFRQVYERFGRIDILVNNAGIWENGTIMDVTEKQWDRMMAINLKGVFFCCQAVYKIMAEQKYGKIVNVASVVGRTTPIINQVHYAVSKSGVIMLTRCLAKELAVYQVNVNAIAPVTTNTTMGDLFTETQLEEIIKNIPLGRIAVPEDMANAVAFLVSDEAAFITGEVINVDGGRLMD